MSNSEPISLHQAHELILKLEQAGLNKKIAQEIIESENNELADKVIKLVLYPIITTEIEPLSLLDLLKRYGIGENGFEDDWWANESFAKDIPEEGTYKTDIRLRYTDLSFQEQKEALSSSIWDIPHPAVFAQVVLKHYAETQRRIFRDWTTRTSLTTSDKVPVEVGCFRSFSFSFGLIVDALTLDRSPLAGIALTRKIA